MSAETDSRNPTTSGLRSPLRFGRIFVEKPWGGRALERVLGLELPPRAKVGETWELVDRDDRNSVVAEGPFAGRRLGGLMLSERDALLGRSQPSVTGAFPLLVKFLSSEETLSVQVHPDSSHSRESGPGDGGKDECWYVLAAEPGAFIYLGMRPGVDAASFADVADSLEVCDLLQSHDVKAGQFVFVPAGTVHAIGAGITLVEIQQNSDVTYRLHDWGRVDKDGRARELHVEEALMAIDWEAPAVKPFTPVVEPLGDVNGRSELLRSQAFDVDLFVVSGEIHLEGRSLARVLVVVEGECGLRSEDEGVEVELSTGQVWLVPAALSKITLVGHGAGARVLLTTAKE